MTIKFYNREKELALLKKVRPPYLAIIYGRRRIGKTALSLEFVKDRDFLYFFVNPKKSEQLLLKEFSEKIGEKIGIPLSLRTWEEFFEVLFKYKGIVIFDEFQKFLEINEAVPFILQKFWDTKREKPTIIITGSVIGMIKKLFMESGSPLFKRADILINLKELRPKDIFKILSDFGINNLEEKFKFYLLFGGVPYYYSLLYKYQIENIREAIFELIVDEHAPLRREVEDVLIEAFKKEYSTYLSIMYAIAEGKTKLEEIASYAGIKTTSISYYLKDLIELLDLVEKHEIKFKNKSIYEIKDRFHYFWLRFMYRYSSIIDPKVLFSKIMNEINDFYGRCFEKMIRDNFLYIFGNYEKVFKYYGFLKKGGRRVSFDIDVLALNEKTRELLLAECKWKDKVNPSKICKELLEKSKYVPWHLEKRKETLAIFAKSFSKKISEFKGIKVYCFDLKDLENLFRKA